MDILIPGINVPADTFDLPGFTPIPCEACQGMGWFDGDDTEPGCVCETCGGLGEIEVCSGCGCIPTVAKGVETCGCTLMEELRVAA